MISLPSLLTFVHLVGLSMGIGAATVKLMLLMKCRSDLEFVPVYARVSRPITRLIISGLILLTLSGIGWLVIGYSFSSLLIIKLVFVAAIWVMGPVIDNVVEPRFYKLMPADGQQVSQEFVRVLKNYLLLEITATLFFYIILIIWVLI
jgi:hypothetical protein